MKKLYEVTSAGGRKITVVAKDSTAAKRLAAVLWGLRSTDAWTGISSMSAKQARKDADA